ncbi:MAG: MATE family efflux transporter [Spirochaetota bacterium]
MQRNTFLRELFTDGAFFTTLFTIGWPIALQHGFVTALNLLDTLMVGQLGEVQIGSVALGNQLFFLVMLFLFGIGSGSAVFVAQYWGKRDIPGIRRSLGLAMLIAIPGSLIAATIVTVAPRFLLRLFTTDGEVVRLGVGYVRMVAPSYLFTALTVVLGSALRATGEVRLPLRMTVIALGLNAILNYMLIFGVGFFPELGVFGAAVGTTVSRGLEAVLLIAAMVKRKHPLVGPFREYLLTTRTLTKRFFTVTAPVVMNEILWSGGMTMYTLVYARMGTAELAASNIAETVIRLTFVAFMGSAGAAAVILGNDIGAGHIGKASRDARRFILLAPLAGVAFAILLAAVSPLVPLLYQVSESVRTDVTRMLLVIACVVPVKSLNLHGIVGIMRSGGDTRFAMLTEGSMLWGIGVPIAAFTGLVLGWPVYFVLAAAQAEEIGKLYLTIRRVITARWIHRVTEHDEETLDVIPA